MQQYLARATMLSMLLGVLGCGTDSPPAPPPVFPEDYAASYTQVRNCRFSLEHDLIRIRVLASPEALVPYMGRTQPFPTGAILVKEQYAEDDTTCSGPIVDYTVMQKLAEGTSPETLGWTWQKVDADHQTLGNEDIKRCTKCHVDCGKPPEGYDQTCTVP